MRQVKLRSSHALIAVVAIGVAERLLRYGADYRALGEAYNVAVAVARGDGFADAYRAGQGPTAHVLPISPAIAGAVYRLFGIGSHLSEVILACWSISLAIGTYILLFRAFGRLGLSAGARVAALSFLCVVPAYQWPEAVDFRIWEGGLATFLTALFLDRLLALDEVTTSSVFGMALLTALLFFVNPLWGLAAYLCAAIFCTRQLPIRRLPGIALSAFVALALFVVPWGIRNYRVFGEPLLSRSNAGLEMALAMRPGALNADDPAKDFLAHQRKIHPTNSDAAFQAMRRAGGEVAYSRNLGARATAWMTQHPGEAGRLALRHIRQAIFPEPWQFTVFGGGQLTGILRAILINAVAFFAMLGIGLAYLFRKPNWIYPTILIFAPAIGMAFFQPVQRYTYLFYPLLVYEAAMAFDVGRNWVLRRYRHRAGSAA